MNRSPSSRSPPLASALAPVTFCALVAFCSVCVAACSPQSGGPADGSLERHVLDSGEDLALSFDGKHDYATTGTAQFPVGHGTQTLSAWFELDAVAGQQALLTLRKDLDSGVQLAVVDGLVTALRVYGNRTLVAASKAVKAGAWHHAAFTFDGTTGQIFVDGVLAASSQNAPDSRTPTTSWLGTLDGTTQLLVGKLDDVRVFSRVRTDAELAAEAAGTFDAADPDLVLDLPCNERSGALLFDHSALANDGELGDGVPGNMPKRVVAAAKPAAP